MGCIGGSIFQGIKGLYNAPRGFDRRLTGSWSAIRTRAPGIGGSFALWGGTFSTIDCTLSHLRQKEDHWNSIASGAATGAILAVRSGTGAMISSAIVGGMILAMIEGISVLLMRYSAPFYQPVSPVEQAAAESKGSANFA